MTRYTLHVPLVLNDGTPTPEQELADVEAYLLDIAGGFTATDGIGGWRGDDGTVYREPVRLYLVDTADDIAYLLRQAAASVALNLDQEAVYVTAAPIQTTLVTAAIPA